MRDTLFSSLEELFQERGFDKENVHKIDQVSKLPYLSLVILVFIVIVIHIL